MLTIESTMVNKSIPCGKTMWSPRFILESYNNDFTIGSKTMETPIASYLLGNITFWTQTISTKVRVHNVIKFPIV